MTDNRVVWDSGPSLLKIWRFWVLNLLTISVETPWASLTTLLPWQGAVLNDGPCYHELYVCFHLFFLNMVSFFSFEDNFAERAVISWAEQWHHTQSTQSFCQVSRWSHCRLVFTEPHRLKLFLMKSPCVRADLKEIEFPLTIKALKVQVTTIWQNAFEISKLDFKAHLSNFNTALFYF